MADITKTNHKGLGLPKHFDPSMEQMKKNMEVIDDILQKAVPNDLTSTTDANGESNANTLKETGNYFIKSNASNIPVSGYAGIISVFKMGTYILQEWRSINSPNYTYRRYSTNTGSSWGGWIKDWNANNDGSGSGLDADLLDGLHSSSFFRVQGTTSNFNSATSEGKWRITGGTNAPYTGCTDWVCIVYQLDGGANELYQLAYEECTSQPTGISGGTTSSYSTGIPLMYVRKRIGGTWYSWQCMWHSGNDGSGSGMDADKLDGKHSNELPYVPVSISTSGSYNIDNYQTEGFYSFATITSAKTLPTWSVSGSGYGLIVKDARGSGGLTCCHQLLFRDGNSEIYIRNNHSSSWSDWVQVGGTANDILTKLKTVDGSGSGLDADLLDGAEGSAYLKVTSLLTELLKVDGSGTELDADLLDGKHASAFAQTNTTAYTDFNSVPLAVGMYGVNGTAINAPVSSTGTYSVIVIKTSTGYMMLAVNTIDSNLYRRHTTGDWSTSTVWTKVGSGTGLQKASATFVTSSGVADSTSNYLKITREEASSELNAGDVIAVTVDTLSSSALTYSYIYSVDSLSFKKQIYKPNGSTQVQPVQIPKYFLLEYNGSTFNIVSPLSDSNFVISENEPSDTSSHPTGTVWFRYYFDN